MCSQGPIERHLHFSNFCPVILLDGQCSVCGTNRPSRLATRSIDSLASVNYNCAHLRMIKLFLSSMSHEKRQPECPSFCMRPGDEVNGWYWFCISIFSHQNRNHRSWVRAAVCSLMNERHFLGERYLHFQVRLLNQCFTPMHIHPLGLQLPIGLALCLHAAVKPIPMMIPATIVTPRIDILAQAARIAVFRLVCWNQNQSLGLRILLGDMPQQKATIFHRDGEVPPPPYIHYGSVM